MKIERAIEILELDIKMDFEGCSDELEAAHRLGIEALQAVKECRASHMFCPGLVMQGETEE